MSSPASSISDTWSRWISNSGLQHSSCSEPVKFRVKRLNPCISRSSAPPSFLGIHKGGRIHKSVFFFCPYTHLDISTRYKFLEAASEAATQKEITSSHTEPDKSAGKGCWLVWHPHGLSCAITFTTVSSPSLPRSCLPSSSQFYSSFSFKVPFAFGSDYIYHLRFM